MNREEILRWLREPDPARLEELWARADAARAERVGDAVHLRGLVEVGNYCVRGCAYCGLSTAAPAVDRYRLPPEEILGCARRAREFGFGTVVLQSGEDPGLTGAGVAETVRRIKAETGLAITLSLGERSEADLRAWREAGADRYLLRFETTDPDLYRAIHPALPGRVSDRVRQLRLMRGLGFEIGTGVMVGIPGQTWASLAQDILTFQELDMDMVGLGPYLPAPGTPLAGELGRALAAQAGAEQVPGDELATLKTLALTRLACPQANIPSTTALATLDPAGGRANGLLRGANVVMPNLTPLRYRVLYQIYPGKAGIHETADISREKIEGQILALGRTIGRGPGGRGREQQSPRSNSSQ